MKVDKSVTTTPPNTHTHTRTHWFPAISEWQFVSVGSARTVNTLHLFSCRMQQKLPHMFSGEAPKLLYYCVTSSSSAVCNPEHDSLFLHRINTQAVKGLRQALPGGDCTPR